MIRFDHRYLHYSAVLVIFFDACAAPIRFYLDKAGIGWLAYLPKVIAWLVVVMALYFQRQPKVVYWLLTVIFFSALVGLTSDVSIFALAFTLFLFSPFVLGVFSDLNELSIGWLKKVAGFVFFITIFGVLLDYFFQFPWEGVETEVMGVVVETSREWTNFDVERLAGFTRLSTAAAFYISVCGLFLYLSVGRFYIKTLFLVLMVVFVYLTTNKTALGAVLIVVLMDFYFRFKYLYKSTVIVLMGFSVIFPIWAVTTFQVGLELAGEDEQMMLASFNERLQIVWPLFFDGIKNVLIGNGLGGVGSPVKLDFLTTGETGVFFADNTFLYLLGWIGVGAVYVYYICARYLIRSLDGADIDRVIGKLVFFVFICGIATDMLESVLPAYLIGAFLHRYSTHRCAVSDEK